jgi:hypothetical protein
MSSSVTTTPFGGPPTTARQDAAQVPASPRVAHVTGDGLGRRQHGPHVGVEVGIVEPEPKVLDGASDVAVEHWEERAGARGGPADAKLRIEKDHHRARGAEQIAQRVEQRRRLGQLGLELFVDRRKLLP